MLGGLSAPRSIGWSSVCRPCATVVARGSATGHLEDQLVHRLVGAIGHVPIKDRPIDRLQQQQNAVGVGAEGYAEVLLVNALEPVPRQSAIPQTGDL